MQQVYNRMLWGWGRGGGLARFAEFPSYEVTMEPCQISVHVTHKLTLSVLQPICQMTHCLLLIHIPRWPS